GSVLGAAGGSGRRKGWDMAHQTCCEGDAKRETGRPQGRPEANSRRRQVLRRGVHGRYASKPAARRSIAGYGKPEIERWTPCPAGSCWFRKKIHHRDTEGAEKRWAGWRGSSTVGPWRRAGPRQFPTTVAYRTMRFAFASRSV